MQNIAKRGVLALAGVALLCGVSVPAGAQPTKDSLKCASSKLNAFGKDVAGRLKCYSKAVGKGVAVDTACLDKAEAGDRTSFQKAEEKGGCATDANFFDVNHDTIPDGMIDSIDHLIEDGGGLTDGINDLILIAIPDPPPAVSKCTSTKLGALSKLGGSLIKCDSKAAKKNEPLDPTCQQKALDKYNQTVTKAEAKVPNDCQTTGDVNELGNIVFRLDSALVLTAPRFDGCGNNLVTPGSTPPENCDDGNQDNFDSCPSDCFIDACTPTATAAPVTLTISSPDVRNLSINLDYPEGKVDLPGEDFTPDVTALVGGTFQPFDFGHALRVVAADAFNFGTTSIATLNFVTCNGAPAPVVGDFPCFVTEAGSEAGPVQGLTCTVTIP